MMLTSKNDQLKRNFLRLFSLGGFSALWGVLRLTWCLSHDTGAFILQGPCRGKGTGAAVPAFSYLPLRIYHSPARVRRWVGARCRQPGERPAAAHAVDIPGKLRETGWFLWAHLDIKSCFELRSRTGNITADLGDHCCHCSCNQGWYENMKINNSFILLFSGRQAFLFITVFIVGCHKYSRMIIPG